MLKDSSGEGFAKLSADFVFCYGSFGFGESYQVLQYYIIIIIVGLWHHYVCAWYIDWILITTSIDVPQLHHAVHKPVDYLHYSLFPRLQLPEHRTDSNGYISSGTLYSMHV